MYLRRNRIEGLREARRAAGLTQQQLAERSGLQRQHVSALEHYRLMMTDERARKLAPHLETHPAALLVGHAAAPILRRGANKPSLTAEDFRALVRAFSAARTTDASNPVLRRDLLRIVRHMSEALFTVWYRLLDDVERDTERAVEAEPS
jgi:transcriptional regulator with XRE-family HTH domain